MILLVHWSASLANKLFSITSVYPKMTIFAAENQKTK